MSQEVKLARPEVFDNFWLPYFSHRQRRAILAAAKQAGNNLDYQPNIAIIIRTKNDKAGLEAIIRHVENEKRFCKSRIDLVVVDTESTDGTVELAKKAGARLVSIRQKDFNYSKGINVGFEVLKPDVEAAFVTVGHALPAVNICLQAAVRHFKDPQVVAVYADGTPNANATVWEKALYYFSSGIYRRLKRGAHITKRMHPGLTQGTNCMVRVKIWRQHPFDEAYAHGGEDLAWGRWALKAKHRLIYEPAVVVHHSHGLGLVNFVRQFKYWIYISIRKGEFKQEKIARYRPDLFD